jgi:hypothetical protein
MYIALIIGQFGLTTSGWPIMPENTPSSNKKSKLHLENRVHKSVPGSDQQRRQMKNGLENFTLLNIDNIEIENFLSQGVAYFFAPHDTQHDIQLNGIHFTFFTKKHKISQQKLKR